jgi:hypothetical protein
MSEVDALSDNQNGGSEKFEFRLFFDVYFYEFPVGEIVGYPVAGTVGCEQKILVTVQYNRRVRRFTGEVVILMLIADVDRITDRTFHS